METMTREQAVDFIRRGSRGRFLTVEFVKRGDGSLRVMLCRYGVKSRLKGGIPAYDPKDHNLVWVWDAHKKDYRSVNVPGMVRIRVNGEWYLVEG